jgi:hypothetical protein
MQTDVILINRFGIVIQQANILKDFITLFKGLTEVVKSKIPQA